MLKEWQILLQITTVFNNNSINENHHYYDKNIKLLLPNLITYILILKKSVHTYTLINYIYNIQWRNKIKDAYSPECKNSCPEKFMNLDSDTVIENVLRDTGVWDIKLIRIRLSKKWRKKYRFFFSNTYYHMGRFTWHD